MNKGELEKLKEHCEKQMMLSYALNDTKHYKEHRMVLELLEENQELKDRIDKAVEIIDLIKPELWNISNKMTYRLLDVKTTLKGDKE